MAFLNGILGVFYDIGITAPTEGRLWETLILNVFNWGFLADYGWRIVVFTLLLKLLLSPVDIFQKISARKNQKVTAKIAPQLEALKKQYPDDQRMLATKQQELMRKNGGGMNPLMTCLPLILTMVVFFTLFSGLSNIGAYKNMNQYVQLYNEYNNVTQCVTGDTTVFLAKDGNPDEARVADYQDYYVKGMKRYVDLLEEDATAEDSDQGKEISEAEQATINDLKARYEAVADKTSYDQVKAFADTLTSDQKTTFSIRVGQRAVYVLYGQTIEGFLWIKNIWAVDAPWVSPVNNFDTFKRNVGSVAASGCGCGGCNGCNDRDNYWNDGGKFVYNAELTEDWGDIAEQKRTEEFGKLTAKETYNNVMGELMDDDDYASANGYMILPILSILFSFGLQWFNTRQQKQSGQDVMGQNSSMKMMMFMMPVMIGFFSFQYTAAFALYLVVSYLVTAAVTLLMSLIYRIMDRNDNNPNKARPYGRPNFNK